MSTFHTTYRRLWILTIAWLTLLLPRAMASTKYTIQNLGTLGGESYAYGINDLGQVVGYCEQPGLQRAFIWTSPGGIKQLSAYAVAYGINNNSQVTGWAFVALSVNHAVRWEADGTTTDLHKTAALSGNSISDGRAINASGQVAGEINSSGAIAGVWNTDKDFVAPFGGSSMATAINNQGQVVGWGDNGKGIAFRYTKATGLESLDPVGYIGSAAYGINNSGEIVGWVATTTGNLMAHWDAHGNLKTLGDGNAYAINDGGDVVGQSSDGHAVLWTAMDGVIDLNNALNNGANWTLEVATSINKFGQIVGIGTFNGARRAFLLTPNNILDHTQALKLQGYFPDKNGKWNYQDVDGIVCDNLPNMQPHPDTPAPNTSAPARASLNYLRIRLPDTSANKNAIVTARLLNSKGVEVRKNDHGSSVGWLDDGHPGYLDYYPPFEFNENQQPTGINDITPSATRTVYINVIIRDDSKKPSEILYVNTQPIVLARPPVVLVHGINSGPESWNALTDYLKDNKLSIPCVAVNHKNPKNYDGFDFSNYRTESFEGIYGGNGPVEIGAALLSDRIKTTLKQVRTGLVITDSDQNRDYTTTVYIHIPNSPYKIPKFMDVKQIHQSSPYGPPLGIHLSQDQVGPILSIRRVDVVAWSYGGVITRWYIDAKEGDASNNASKSWYRRQGKYGLPGRYSLPNFPLKTGITEFNIQSHIYAVPYNGDVRKVITLGSMWRGVPLINYVNEALFGRYFLSAPFIPNAPHSISTMSLMFDHLPIPTSVPSLEVMAIESKWMRQLIYQSPTSAALTARPFNADIAYGSVAGDNAGYPLDIPIDNVVDKSIYTDVNHLVDVLQQPSWFPYLALETDQTDWPLHIRQPTDRTYSDGLVPIWSAAIPGSYIIAPITHNAYPSDRETREYAIQWLNNSTLPSGNLLNSLWNAPETSAISNLKLTKTWTFNTGKMAPYPQCDFYVQSGGVGRITLLALGSPSIRKGQATATVTRQGADAVINVTIKNTGTVLLPDVQITSATIIDGNLITYQSLEPPIKCGTVVPSRSVTTQIRFSSIGTVGHKAKLVVHYNSAGIDIFQDSIPLP